MALITNIEDLTTFSTPQEILQAISKGIEDVEEPIVSTPSVEKAFEIPKGGLKGGYQPSDYTNMKEVLKKQEVKSLHDIIGNDGISKDIMNNKEYLRGGSFKPSDYTNTEEVLKKSDPEKWKNQEIYKKTHAGKIAISEGLIPKDKKYIPTLKPEKTKINSAKLDKLDKMLESIDKATNGKITTHKPVSTIMNLPKKDRAEAVKKLGFKVRDDLKKLNETLKNNPRSLNLSPREKLELEMFMAKVNMQGGPDKFVEHNFKLTPDELKLGKTELEQAKEKDEAQKAKVEAERKEQSSQSKTNESQKKEPVVKEVKDEKPKEANKEDKSKTEQPKNKDEQKKEDSKDKKEPTKEEKTLSQDKESQKKEPLLKEAKDEKPKENEKSSKENNSKEDKTKETKTKEFSVKEHKSEPSTKEEKPKEATKTESALKENKETVKTLDLKTTGKTSNDLVAKASDTKDVKPVMSGPTAAPTSPTQNLNVGGRV